MVRNVGVIAHRQEATSRVPQGAGGLSPRKSMKVALFGKIYPEAIPAGNSEEWIPDCFPTTQENEETGILLS